MCYLVKDRKTIGRIGGTNCNIHAATFIYPRVDTDGKDGSGLEVLDFDRTESSLDNGKFSIN